MVTTNEPNVYETGVLDSNAEGNFVYTTLDAAINWIRKNSLWPMPMGLSCCAIEFMAVACSRYDLSRFGSEVTRFSPRQADVMIVAGTVTYKMALAVRRIWDQMPEPKWCIAMGACASTGGMFRSYSVLQGVDKIIPVDVYISGCPPRPEAILEALLTPQEAGYPAARTHVLQEGGTARSQRPRAGRDGNASRINLFRPFYSVPSFTISSPCLL